MKCSCAPRLRVLNLTGLILANLSVQPHAAESRFSAYVAGPGEVAITHQDAEILRFTPAVWGPNWSWAGVDGDARSKQGLAADHFKVRIGTNALQLAFRAASPASNRLELSYELTSASTVDLTLFAVELAPGGALAGQTLSVFTGGTTKSVKLPLGKGVLGESVSRLELAGAAIGKVAIRFNPACEVAADGAARLVLAKNQLEGGEIRKLTATIDLPGPLSWYSGVGELPDEPGLDTWFAWHGTGDTAGTILDMTDWFKKPAGKQGRIKRNGEHLIYAGKPIKLWGLNLCYSACSPEKALADKRALLYPQYGINTVRLHKFADGTGWSGIQSKESAAEYDPAGLERMDYQVARFKEAGLFLKLSAHFGTIKIGPADLRDVPYAGEFGNFDQRNDRIAAPHSAFFYSPELQNLHLRQITNLLKHRNPHTGLTYAEDPAICAIEIINEQSILFFTSMGPLKASPTLRKRVSERFSGWLRERYGTHQGLLQAWGPKGLDGFEQDGFPAGEHLDKKNILPLGSPWYWDPDQLNGSQAFRKRRLLDTLEFLYSLQCEAYDRYVAAVRKAGYDGEILGSNWQAGRAFSHYANLHSDSRVGLIDRHNYFGGGGRGKGRFNAGSMLARPGSGSLSSGLQQVDDDPFMLSEWIHVFPNEWGIEGPAIIGAYGMGLQGWDASYMFQNGDDATFSRQLGRSEWDVVAPQILGVFPAVSRQVLRGDVEQSKTSAVRNVHVPSLFQGRLGFEDKVVQGYDDKELDSSKVPAAALAVARCTVRFTDSWQETPAFPLAPHWQDGFLVSSTDQLRWKPGQGITTSGYFTINTKATKAVVGFARDQSADLSGWIISPQSRFAAIYLTAPERNAELSDSTRLLLIALARARNTGMKFNPAGDELLQRGNAPVLMEPVRATIQTKRPGTLTVYPLDHNGRRTDKQLRATDGSFSIDTSRDATPYYELRFE